MPFPAPAGRGPRPCREQLLNSDPGVSLENGCRSRMNTGDRPFPKKPSGDAFGVPRFCCLFSVLSYFFFAVFLAAFFAGFFATAFLVAIFPILPLSSRHRTCKRYFAVNECIESQKNSVKKKIAFREYEFTHRNR